MTNCNCSHPQVHHHNQTTEKGVLPPHQKGDRVKFRWHRFLPNGITQPSLPLCHFPMTETLLTSALVTLHHMTVSHTVCYFFPFLIRHYASEVRSRLYQPAIIYCRYQKVTKGLSELILLGLKWNHHFFNRYLFRLNHQICHQMCCLEQFLMPLSVD